MTAKQEIEAEAAEGEAGEKDGEHGVNGAEERFKERPEGIPEDGEGVIDEAGGEGGEDVIGFVDGLPGGEGMTHPPEVPVEVKVVGDDIAGLTGEVGGGVEERPVEGDEGEQEEGQDDRQQAEAGGGDEVIETNGHAYSIDGEVVILARV